MAALRRFLAILVADLRERTRSPRFWVVLVGMMIAAWWCFPRPDASYLIVAAHGGERGFYSSAWVGMVLATVFSTLLSLCGFYVVRGTLVRDIDTRVWQLLVATPMTRGGYLLAKWASHMAVFLLIAMVSLGVGLAAQWIHAEDRSIDLVELVKPFLILNLPGLAVTSMLAVWFDLLPWLRRTAGNVLFFILWVLTLSVPLAQLESPDYTMMRTGWVSDQNGMVLIARDLHRVREQQTGKPQEFGFNVGSPAREGGPLMFEWKSWSVRPMDLLGRALWLAFAIVGVLLAAPLLDWAAARGSTATKARSQAGSRLRWLDRLLEPLSRGAFGVLAVAELKLSLRGRRFWWWLAALVAFGLQSFGDARSFQVGMLLAWILPLDILARGILQEREHGTGGLVFAAPNILGRLLAVRLVVGVALLLALTLPGMLRLLATHPVAALAALSVAFSISSWGLCLGALFGTSRPFELLLVSVAYLSMQGAMLLDLSVHPQLTALWHATLLLPAWLLLAWAWPRLARRRA